MSKILVIDDADSILKMMRSLLTRKGYAVCTAESGVQGMAIAEQEQPDLILLDVNMPGMDGGEVRDALLHNIKTLHIPVVFLTSLVTEEEAYMQKDLRKGDSYMSKLSDPEALVKKIEEALGKTKRA